MSGFHFDPLPARGSRPEFAINQKLERRASNNIRRPICEIDSVRKEYVRYPNAAAVLEPKQIGWFQDFHPARRLERLELGYDRASEQFEAKQMKHRRQCAGADEEPGHNSVVNLVPGDED